MKLTKKSAHNEIKRKWTEACHSVGGSYVQGRTSGEILTSQVDFGWALWKAQKSAAFSLKAKNYLLDKVGHGRKLVRQPPLMWLPKCPVYRQDRPEMLSETDWLIEQQIARYFSRLSVLAKVVLLKRSPSVSMNERLVMRVVSSFLFKNCLMLLF